VDVRLARIGDERAIAEVHVRVRQAAYRGQIPDAVLGNLSVDRRIDTWSQILTQYAPPATAMVLENEDQAVGFAHIAASRDEDASDGIGEVTAIYVSHDFWRSGGGTLLMTRARAALTDAGFSHATLWVLDTNERARRFYESDGWKLDGATKIDERDGFQLTEVRYRRDLRR